MLIFNSARAGWCAVRVGILFLVMLLQAEQVFAAAEPACSPSEFLPVAEFSELDQLSYPYYLLLMLEEEATRHGRAVGGDIAVFLQAVQALPKGASYQGKLQGFVFKFPSRIGGEDPSDLDILPIGALSFSDRTRMQRDLRQALGDQQAPKPVVQRDIWLFNRGLREATFEQGYTLEAAMEEVVYYAHKSEKSLLYAERNADGAFTFKLMMPCALVVQLGLLGEVAKFSDVGAATCPETSLAKALETISAPLGPWGRLREAARNSHQHLKGLLHGNEVKSLLGRALDKIGAGASVKNLRETAQ